MSKRVSVKVFSFDQKTHIDVNIHTSDYTLEEFIKDGKMKSFLNNFYIII
jgi:hypothetical protein